MTRNSVCLRQVPGLDPGASAKPDSAPSFVGSRAVELFYVGTSGGWPGEEFQGFGAIELFLVQSRRPKELPGRPSQVSKDS